MILSGRNRNPKQELTHLDIGSVEKNGFLQELGFLLCFGFSCLFCWFGF